MILQIIHLYVLPFLVAVGPLCRLISNLLEQSHPRIAGVARLFAGLGADPHEMARGLHQASGLRRPSLPSLVSAEELHPRPVAPSTPDREPSLRHPSRPSWDRPGGSS